MLIEIDKNPASVQFSYIDASGKQCIHYYLDFAETLCLSAGYKAALRYAIIKRWRALESGEATPWHMEVLRLARNVEARHGRAR